LNYCNLENNKCEDYYGGWCYGELCAEAKKTKNEMDIDYKEKKRKKLLSLKLVNEKAIEFVKGITPNKSTITEYDYLMSLVNDKLDSIQKEIGEFERYYKEII
jgi:hypothetical protein